MNGLNASDFRRFFEDLHDKPPFPWQISLAEQVCSEGWPDVIDLPTASGKTACIDIALFAMAIRERAPRRIFFIVDRRVVVSEASVRARDIAEEIERSFGRCSGGRGGGPA